MLNRGNINKVKNARNYILANGCDKRSSKSRIVGDIKIAYIVVWSI